MSSAGEAHGSTGPNRVDGLVEHLFRRQAGMMLATLTRIFGPANLDLVEDVVQDSLLKALEQWPYTGVPQRPAAWLVQAAKNRAVDVLRRQALLPDKAQRVLEEWRPLELDPDEALAADQVADDVLRMLFMCCHPDIRREGRVALALKAVAGLGVSEIGGAFLAEEATIAQRIVRAKRQIRDQGIAFEVPRPPEFPGRLDSVLEVLYLWFNEGYAAHQGAELVRDDLCQEAIRLCAVLARHPATDLPKCHALLALMLFQAARFPSRVDGEGNLLLLREQDRSRWDRRLIRRGLCHLERCAEGDDVTPYHLEAGIASCHALAKTYEETDWRQIIDLYDRLYRLHPSPVVALNRAIALSRLRGPTAGITEVEALKHHPALARYHLLPAVLGELWREAGDPAKAARFLHEALAAPCSDPERRFLIRRLGSLTAKEHPDVVTAVDPGSPRSSI